MLNFNFHKDSPLPQRANDNVVLDRGQFYLDVIDFLSGRKTVNMDPFTYSQPNSSTDPTNGAFYWAKFLESNQHYYLKKAEIKLIENNTSKISQLLANVTKVIELGPGSRDSVVNKTIPFLASLPKKERYTAIELCEQYLTEGKSEIMAAFDKLQVNTIHDDFYDCLFDQRFTPNTAVLCLGNTLANVPENPGTKIPLNLINKLTSLNQSMAAGSKLIIGLDCNQDEESIFAAYDHGDFQEHNRALIHLINREFPTASLNPKLFDIDLHWCPEIHRLSISLVSQIDQIAHIYDQDVYIPQGKKLHVTSSYKFPVKLFKSIAKMSGFKIIKCLADSNKQSAIYILESS